MACNEIDNEENKETLQSCFKISRLLWAYESTFFLERHSISGCCEKSYKTILSLGWTQTGKGISMLDRYSSVTYLSELVLSA